MKFQKLVMDSFAIPQELTQEKNRKLGHYVLVTAKLKLKQNSV